MATAAPHRAGRGVPQQPAQRPHGAHEPLNDGHAATERNGYDGIGHGRLTDVKLGVNTRVRIQSSPVRRWAPHGDARGDEVGAASAVVGVVAVALSGAPRTLAVQHHRGRDAAQRREPVPVVPTAFSSGDALLSTSSQKSRTSDPLTA